MAVPGSSRSLPRIELDVPNQRLLWGQRQIALTPKAFALLHHLVERPHQLISKQEVLAAVWPGVLVEEGQVRQFVTELRQLLLDDPAAPRFIETVRGRGYRFIGDIALRGNDTLRVGAQAPRTVEAQPPEPTTPHFVGRNAELAKLHAAFDKASMGQRQLVFVSGEAGIGKTALADAFVTELVPARDESAAANQAPRLNVARGECIEQYGAGEPYLPVLEALSRLCRQAGGHQRVALLRRYAPTWLAQLPGLLDDAEAAALQLKVAGSSAERMLREMVDAIEAVAADEPLVLVFEDMHWSDRSTVEWLSMLARRREAARLLVIVTCRQVELNVNDHPLRTVKQDLVTHGFGVDVALGYLAADVVQTYVERRLPGLAGHVASGVYRRSQGHPLFMVHVTDDVERQGPAGQANDAAENAVPGGLRELIESQLARLEPAQQAGLEAASVAGAEFAVASVAAALQGEPEQVERVLEVLAAREQFIEARGLAEWHDGTFSGCYAFRHDLYRETLYRRLGAARRVQCHARIGERLALAHGERSGEIAAELALHFERAREPGRAARHCRDAGETSLRRYAYREAIAHVDKGLALLQTVATSVEHDRTELLLRLTQGAALLPTKGFGALEVEETYRRAQALSVRLDDNGALAPVLAGLGNVYMTRVAFAPARDVAEQLLALAQRQQQPAVSMVAHNSSARVLMLTGELAAALTHAESTLALYDLCQHRVLAVEYVEDPGVVAHSVAAIMRWILGYPDTAARHIEQGLALARSLDHPFSEVQQLWSDGLIGLDTGDLGRLEATTERLVSLCIDNDFPHHRAAGHILRAGALARKGDIAQALALADQGLREWRGLGILFLPHQLAVVATIYATNDRVVEALHLLDEALATVEQTGERWYEAELHRLQGELTLRLPEGASNLARRQAETCFQRAIKLAQRQQAKTFELRAATSLARLWLQQGKTAAARPMLSAICGWFTEGFETRDLKDAAALLVTLGQGERSR